MATRPRNRKKTGDTKKRAGSRKKNKNTVSQGLVGGGLIAAFLLWQFIRTHPTLSVVIAAALLATGAAGFALWRRARRSDALLQAERDQAIEVTDGMSGVEFERWTARLLARSGCKEVHVVGGSGDAGADVVALAPDGSRVVVQCKRYGESKVGSKAVQLFAGTNRLYHKADISLLVTTSTFTLEARKVAAVVGIVLVDRAILAEWARTNVAPLHLSSGDAYC